MHHRILYFVRKYPGGSVGDLLAALDVTKQSLHGPMSKLVEAGLLHAARSKESRRTKVLVLTRAGAALEAKLSGLRARAWRDVMFELGGRKANAKRAAPSACATAEE